MTRTVIEKNIDPAIIAEEFVIQELIKMFPQATEAFYDKIRFFVRQYRQVYSDDKFWRLIEGFSDYMLKRHYRLLRGDVYTWSLQEVPVEDLEVRMFVGTGKLDEIIQHAKYNAKKAGEALRKLTPEERMQLIDPFKFSKDNYPVIVQEEEDGRLVVHDGNRRVLNMAIYGLPTIKAYVGKRIQPPGKPAIPESFFTNFVSLLKDMEQVTDETVESLVQIMRAVKENYNNGPQMVDMYTRKYFLPLVKTDKQKKIVEKILTS